MLVKLTKRQAHQAEHPTNVIRITLSSHGRLEQLESRVETLYDETLYDETLRDESDVTRPAE